MTQESTGISILLLSGSGFSSNFERRKFRLRSGVTSTYGRYVNALRGPAAGRRRCAERFDRVYVRDGGGVQLEPTEAEVVRVGPRPLSDHHPLRVRLVIRERV